MFLHCIKPVKNALTRRLNKQGVALSGLSLALMASISPVLFGFGPAFALEGQAEINQLSEAPTRQAVVRTEYLPNEYGTGPTIIWQSSNSKPKAVIVTLHGLIMHGGTFDSIARKLVNQGYLVAANDMRGYGRWRTGKSLPEVSYDESFEDIRALVKKLKSEYPDAPLFCVGESLGADMSMRIASSEPKLIDGLVLSSPAIKHQAFLGTLVTKAPVLLAHPSKEIDLIPYIRKYSSEDPRIIDGALNDPLVRKRLSAAELVKSVAVFKASLGYARQIPASIPVLVMQGSRDRIVKSNAVVSLLGCLKSTDQTVRWFNARGHLLLETDYVYPDTMQIVTGWLKEHVDEAISMRDGFSSDNPDNSGSSPESAKLTSPVSSGIAGDEVKEAETSMHQDKLSEDLSKSRL